MRTPCCPHCGLLTLQGRVSGARAFACEQCQGHYVDGASLREYLRLHVGDRAFERLLQRARDAQPSTRELTCPDCETASYHEVRGERLLLDACATCGGLYLDKGEADLYLHRVRVPLTATATANRIADRPYDTSISADLVNELFNFLY